MNSQDNFQKQYDAILRKQDLANSYGNIYGRLGGTFGNYLGCPTYGGSFPPVKYYKPIMTEHFLDCAGKVYQTLKPSMTFEEYVKRHLQGIKISA